MNKRMLLPLGLALALSLTACSSGDPAPLDPVRPSLPVQSEEPAVTATPQPEESGRNPLTGEPMDEELAARRPVAVMLNNIKAALPQLGNSQADIIYECLAEGGITRMLGVYQAPQDVEMIGSIRSSRPYYLELALGHDALYIHAGGSDDAYSKMSAWGVDHFDAVRGPYLGNSPGSNMMWRDADRRKNNGLEHSVVATGESIETYLPDSVRRDHEEGYRYPQQFADDGAPAGGETANTVKVPFSSYKTGVFTYDEAQKQYLVSEYGNPYIDGSTGQQVGVTNVLVVKTACKATGDYLAHITVDLTGSGEGYFACGGKLVPITWSKADRNSPFVYTTQSGESLVLGRGSSYVNIVPLDADVTYE